MRVLIAVATLSARCLYAVMKAVLPVRRKIVFLSRQSDACSRDFELLADALCLADPGLEIVTRCRMLGTTLGARAASAIAMIGQMYHLATARACVVDGYVIPVSLLQHRKGLFVVQMWHALGAIKKFGYQTVGRPGGHGAGIASAMRMHRNYDLVLCDGPATVPVFAEAFGVEPGIVEPLGLPRIDYLLDAAAVRRSGSVPEGSAALRAEFPLLAEKGRTVVLYAPTFRKSGAARYAEVAARFADDRYALIVKPHPLEEACVGGANVVNAGGADILDVLPLCDAVITDYSAVAFEAVAMGLPVYFYVFDIDEYARDCGLNVDPLAELPEVASRDVSAIAERIEAGCDQPASLRAFRERYASAPAGCADRIAARVLSETGA